MPEPTLYLFDGYNLLHQAPFDDPRELTDLLASFVAIHGARGVLVWDGVGTDAEVGPLSVRYAAHADAVLERLAAEHRGGERVCLVSSDLAVRARPVRRSRSSRRRLPGRPRANPAHEGRTARVSPTRSTTRRAPRLERLRRGQPD